MFFVFLSLLLYLTKVCPPNLLIKALLRRSIAAQISLQSMIVPEKSSSGNRVPGHNDHFLRFLPFQEQFRGHRRGKYASQNSPRSCEGQRPAKDCFPQEPFCLSQYARKIPEAYSLSPAFPEKPDPAPPVKHRFPTG